MADLSQASDAFRDVSEKEGSEYSSSFHLGLWCQIVLLQYIYVTSLVKNEKKYATVHLI